MNETKPEVLFSETQDGRKDPKYVFFPDTGEVVPYLDACVALTDEKTPEHVPLKRCTTLPVLVHNENGELEHLFDYDLNRRVLTICDGVELRISSKGITLCKKV